MGRTRGGEGKGCEEGRGREGEKGERPQPDFLATPLHLECKVTYSWIAVATGA